VDWIGRGRVKITREQPIWWATALWLMIVGVYMVTLMPLDLLFGGRAWYEDTLSAIISRVFPHLHEREDGSLYR
jgi:hypothetical protein